MIEPFPSFVNTRFARRYVAVLLFPLIAALWLLAITFAWLEGDRTEAWIIWRFERPTLWFRETWNG